MLMLTEPQIELRQLAVGLIRRAMDESDTATDERARIAARLAGSMQMREKG